MNLKFSPESLIETEKGLGTLAMAGLGMVGIFIVVLIMMASVYGVTILSTKISKRKKKGE